MNGDAIKTILGAAKQPLMLDGFSYRPADWIVEDPLALIKPGPSASTLAVATLGAVRDYLKANLDSIELSRTAVHVVTPANVQVLGPLGHRSRTRECFVMAAALDMTIGFLSKYMPLEEFLIGLQTRFAGGVGDADLDDRDKLLTLLASVKSENVNAALDDGRTQTVTARTGVVLVAEVAVPNPVTLTPFRTFRDIVQPASVFLLRVAKGPAGGLPQVGLFEADGGAWRLAATARIVDWLREALPKDVAIYG